MLKMCKPRYNACYDHFNKACTLFAKYRDVFSFLKGFLTDLHLLLFSDVL